MVLSLTACSQSLVEFEHGGTKYVGIPVDTWEQVVARRLSANDLNRARARSIALLNTDVEDVRSIARKHEQDALDERQGKLAAIGERDAALVESGKLAKKLKRRTPWATAMKVQVGVLVAIGGWQVYQTLKP